MSDRARVFSYLSFLRIVFGTCFAMKACFPFPPGVGRGGWGETPGISVPPGCTPTPASPVEGKGAKPRTAKAWATCVLTVLTFVQQVMDEHNEREKMYE